MWQNIQKFQDLNNTVTKFVFEKQDIAIEAVLYRYPTYQERTVLCISVMCGCPIGCRFCGTGDFFARNLTADEIVGQAQYILENEIGGINPFDINKLQIMFMSMGEPMLNRHGLEPALYRLNALYPKAALLISTSGPKVDYTWLEDVSVHIDKIGLQFSVHESSDAKRDELIPFKSKLTLEEIAQTGKYWFQVTGRKPFFNYCAHDGNNYFTDALKLRDLFDSNVWEATVSVICERENGFTKSNGYQKELAANFASKLVGLGFSVRVFDPAGQDTIGGGCGQLFYVQEWASKNCEKVRPSCGNGLTKIHAPMLKNCVHS